MSTGSYLESHLGVSLDQFLELAPEPRGERIRERVADLHAFLEEGRPVHSRALPARTRDRAVALRRALREAAGGGAPGAVTLDARLLTDEFLRHEYAADQNVYLSPFFTRELTQAVPDLVFQPLSTAEVVAALAWARTSRVPLTLRGAGTTALGGAVPAGGGVVLDLARLDSVEIDADGGVVVLGAGARLRPVHERLAARRLALRVYPSNPGGTFAGWFATGGIGLNAYCFGRARDAVRWAEVVLPTGDVVRFARGGEIDVGIGTGGAGRRLDKVEARVWFAERGLPALVLEDLAGTEGQLGVITRLAVEIVERPEHACFLLEFADAASAFAGVEWVRKWAGTAFPAPTNLKWLSAATLAQARRAWADDDARAWRRVPSELSSGANLPWTRLVGPDECGWLESEELPGKAGGSEPRAAAPAAYLFVDFPGKPAGMAFARLLAKAPGRPHVLAQEGLRLGAERFRPQSMKRLGPGLLAAEILLDAARVRGFLAAAERLARGAGVEIDAEVYYLADGTALVLAGYLTDARLGSVLIDLLLAPALMDLALARFAGRPYVLGRWASGFFARTVGGERARHLRAIKRRWDPRWILGRGVFFAGGFRGLQGRVAAAAYAPGVRVARVFCAAPLFQPLVGAARLFLGWWPGPLAGRGRTAEEAPPAADGTFAPAIAAARAVTCVNCGECNSVCPVFRDSAVPLPQMLTHLGEVVAAGGEPGRAGAVLLDLCMRCGNCEEVCQAGIPHLPLYEAMQGASDRARPRDPERHLAILGAVRASRRYTREFLKLRPGGYLKRTPASLPGLVRFVLQRAENDAGPAATCVHCGACVPVCPTGANVEFKEGDARLIGTDQARCIGCGECVEICPANLANGGQTLRVVEAPTLEWMRIVRQALTLAGAGDGGDGARRGAEGAPEAPEPAGQPR